MILGAGEENIQDKLGFHITSYLYIIKTYLFPLGTLVLGHTTVLVQLSFPGMRETPPKFQLVGQFQFFIFVIVTGLKLCHLLFVPLHPG